MSFSRFISIHMSLLSMGRTFGFFSIALHNETSMRLKLKPDLLSEERRKTAARLCCWLFSPQPKGFRIRFCRAPSSSLSPCSSRYFPSLASSYRSCLHWPYLRHRSQSRFYIHAYYSHSLPRAEMFSSDSYEAICAGYINNWKHWKILRKGS